MSDSTGENAAVEKLLAERDALHSWLERLAAATVTASDTVRERVRRDYQQQLDRVASELRRHGDAVAKKLAEDRAEYAELSARTESSREELAEVELRHAVGEFSPDRYEADRKRHLSDLETFEVSLAAIAARIQRMDDVLVLAHRTPVSPDLEMVGATTMAAPEMSILDLTLVEIPAPGSTEPAALIDTSEVIEPEGTVSIDLLAPEDETDRMLSIFNAPETLEHVGDEPRPVAATTALPDFGPLSFRPSGTGTPSEPTLIGLPPDSPPRFVRPGDRLAPTAPARPTTPPPVVPPPPVGAEGSKGQPESTATASSPGQGIFSEEIVASGPTPSSQALPVARTLRCVECGAMNRPLEWYCEKCGAELSAV